MLRNLTQGLALLLAAALLTAGSCNTQITQLKVSITSPNADTHTNGTLTIQVAVTGGTPDQVSLLLDGNTFVTLTSPYTFTWDTTSLTEGSYALTAQATLAGKTFTSNPRVVTVDRTPPTVVTRTPSPGTTNVSLADPITVSFSEAIKASTVNDSSVTLTGQGNVNLGKTLSLDSMGDTLTLALPASPTLPNTLTVTLTSSITDLAGNPLTPPSGVWSWSVPEYLMLGGKLSAETGATGAEFPSLALDISGNPTVVWDEGNFIVNNIYVWRWNGSSWQPLGSALSAEPGATGAFVPSLALDSPGNPTVAWYESDGTTNNIYVQRWSGSSWQALGGKLSAEPGATGAFDPSLALDSPGNPTVAWEEATGTAQNIYVWRWSGSNWQPLGSALSAEPGATDAFDPSLALDSSDNPTVAWYESDGTAQNIHVWHWNGSSWQPLGSALSAEPGITGAISPSLALDNSGNPTVAWYESDGTTTNTQVRRYNALP